MLLLIISRAASVSSLHAYSARWLCAWSEIVQVCKIPGAACESLVRTQIIFHTSTLPALHFSTESPANKKAVIYAEHLPGIHILGPEIRFTCSMQQWGCFQHQENKDNKGFILQKSWNIFPWLSYGERCSSLFYKSDKWVNSENFTVSWKDFWGISRNLKYSISVRRWENKWGIHFNPRIIDMASSERDSVSKRAAITKYCRLDWLINNRKLFLTVWSLEV